MKTLSKSQQRDRRHRRVRAKVAGSEARPRLSVYKSNTRVVAQIIDDERGVTLAAVSSAGEKGKTPREKAEAAATTLAKRAGEKGVKKVVFDRGGFQYLGTIKAFADAARKAGLEF
ncbi:MAG: 50S ribosomal protein L18 [Patescibacteria group bacterium]